MLKTIIGKLERKKIMTWMLMWLNWKRSNNKYYVSASRDIYIYIYIYIYIDID